MAVKPGALNKSLMTSPFDVQVLIFSFVGLGELLSSTNRVNKSVRKILEDKRLSNSEKMLNCFLGIVTRDVERGRPHHAVVQHRCSFPLLAFVPALRHHLNSSNSMPKNVNLFFVRQEQAETAAEGLCVPQHVSLEGYAQFCKAHPPIPNAFEAVNILPSFLNTDFSNLVSHLAQPQHHSTQTWENRPAVAEKWRNFLASCDYAPKQDLEYCGIFIPNLEHQMHHLATILHPLVAAGAGCFAAKIIELLDKFIVLLNDPKVNTQLKKQALSKFWTTGENIRRSFEVVMNAYNHLAGPFLLEHVLFKTLIDAFPHSEKPSPVACVLLIHDRLSEQTWLRRLACDFLERHSDQINANELDSYFYPYDVSQGDRPSFNFKGVATLLKIMKLLESKVSKTVHPNHDDKKDKP